MGIIGPAMSARGEDDAPFKIWVADRLAFEDNLYRLPKDIDPQLSPAPDGRRGDYLNRLSLGLAADWRLSRQAIKLDVRADQNRFSRNEQLDNTSGTALGEWAWRLGNNWKGDAGADYTRSLASFANTRFLEKDLLETTGVFWNTSFTAGRWTLRAGARQSETQHSVEIRQFDDSRTRSGTFGIRYTTPLDNTLGWHYRYTKASFDKAATLNGEIFDRNYDENTASFEVSYGLGNKTRLDLSAGYLHREYPYAELSGVPKGSFGGSIWDVSLKWQPTHKMGLTLGGWRKLRAYLDAESDYFVAEGYSLAPVWTPSERVRVALEISYEEQDYLGSSVNLLLPGSRHDRMRAGELSIAYRFTRMLDINLSGRAERRDSDRSELRYEAGVVGLGVRLTY